MLQSWLTLEWKVNCCQETTARVHLEQRRPVYTREDRWMQEPVILEDGRGRSQFYVEPGKAIACYSVCFDSAEENPGRLRGWV